MVRGIWLGLAGVALAAIALGVARVARGGGYETPAYTVVERTDSYEIREYAPVLEARVTVDGDFDTAVSRGFRVLAGYIFGGNQGSRRVAMTTPVTAVEGQQIAMTAPVTATAGGSAMDARTWTITFSMPSEFTEATLPVPNDQRIVLSTAPSERVAVRRFSGQVSATRAQERLDELLAALRAAGYAPSGPARVAQYDAPYVPGPFRTNEVMVPLPAP